MLSTLALLVVATVSVNASNAQTLLESARAMQAERWATVKNYTITTSFEAAQGLQTPVYYEKMEVDGQPAFRMVPPGEYYNAASENAGFPPAKEVAAGMVPGRGMLGDALAMGGGDMPPMDVRDMTSKMAIFAGAAATAKQGDGKAEAKDAVKDMAEFAKRARLEGIEKVRATSDAPGELKDAYLLVADDVSDIKLDQPKGEAKFTLSKVSLWLDKDHLVPLRLLMEGEVQSKGKNTPMQIEKRDLDYKQVGPLYESHHQVYRMAGMMEGMSEKEKKELEKARADFEKAKAQLASMPPDQKAMVEKMMKGQMEKFEAMTSGEAITTTTDVKSIAINEGPPTPYGPGDLTVGGPAAATYPNALTLAIDEPNAELAVVAMLPEFADATIGLFLVGPFPESGQVEIGGATGHAKIEGKESVSIEEGSGVVTVTERSPTRIKGTFTALLTGYDNTKDTPEKVHFSAEGKFDSGAPASADQELRGSPIPADLLKKK